MNNTARYQANPTNLHISRSRFHMQPSRATTFVAGELIPILNYELIQPGDTIKMKLKTLIRSTTPIAPVMDDAWLDVYFFFVPHKLVLNRESMSNVTGAQAAAHSFKAWIGAKDSLLNVQYPEHTALPLISIPNSSRVTHSIADQLGYPLQGYSGTLYVTPWSMLSYWSVWNNFFRDPNTTNPITFQITSSPGSPTGYTIQGFDQGNRSVNRYCQFVSRRHGYFGSALPWPQRNSQAVTLPLGDLAPVVVKNEGSTPLSVSSNNIGMEEGRSLPVGGKLPTYFGASLTAHNDDFPAYADLSVATAATVNQLRTAFALQRYYEKLARGGNSIQDMTKALFGVTPHDFNDDMPEFLGGKSILIQNHLVANTAGTTYSTESQQSIGSTGAFSLSHDEDYIFTKSFDTWGTLLAVCCVRPRESFSQGLDRQFTKFDAMDLYDPTKAHLGEMPVYKMELFANGSAADNEVFGYQEYAAEYRMIPDKTTGLLRAGKSLSYWTYVNNFSTHPTLKGYLSGEHLKDNIDNTLQVKSTASDLQYMAQFDFDMDFVRAMPTYSIPGLIDHD